MLNHAFQNEEDKRWNAKFNELLKLADIKPDSQIGAVLIKIRSLNGYVRKLLECTKGANEDVAIEMAEKNRKTV